MSYKSRFVAQPWRAVLILFLVALGSSTIFRFSSAARSGAGTTSQQDVLRLETRLNQLEQRFYSIEASVRNLEQQSRIAAVNSRTVNPEDWAFLRSEIQLLQRRLVENECALAKLDERTLAANVRATRKRSGTIRDACRSNVEEPLQLPEFR